MKSFDINWYQYIIILIWIFDGKHELKNYAQISFMELTFWFVCTYVCHMYHWTDWDKFIFLKESKERKKKNEVLNIGRKKK